jgi:microcystin-dependent protein
MIGRLRAQSHQGRPSMQSPIYADGLSSPASHRNILNHYRYSLVHKHRDVFPITKTSFCRRVYTMDPFIGQLMLVCFNFAPQNWMFCDGSLLPIAQYQALFSLLGTAFGGNGTTNFALPDLRSRVPVGATLSGGGPSLTPYQMGEVGGSETVGLNITQMPIHSHLMVTNDTSETQNTSSHHYLGGGGRTPVYAAQVGITTLAPDAVSVAGGNVPHENRQPFLGLNWIIAVNGIFPSRS